MKITADTNVLVRVIVRDEPVQAAAAEKVLREASYIVISLPCLCEVVWVLRRFYRFDRATTAKAIQTLIDSRNVITNRVVAEAGLALLVTGGDFADGVIAHEGARLGGEVFVSFDRRAVTRLTEQGVRTLIPD